MIKDSQQRNLFLLCIIVNHNLGRKTLKMAKRMGILGGTVILARGIVNDGLLDLFELCDSRKEMVLMLAPDKLGHHVLRQLSDKLHLDQDNCGVAFGHEVSDLIGSHSYDNIQSVNEEIEETSQTGSSDDVEAVMYKAIYTVVDKGRGEDVISSAGKMGAKGGTVINARGSGIHETAKLFAMEIEPEKELVLIILDSERTNEAIDRIKKDLELDKPGKGIMFVLDVSEAYGLRK